jgi:hypothetical protein
MVRREGTQFTGQRLASRASNKQDIKQGIHELNQEHQQNGTTLFSFQLILSEALLLPYCMPEHSGDPAGDPHRIQQARQGYQVYARVLLENDSPMGTSKNQDSH